MSRTYPWTDGYVWAVALQLKGNYFPQWSRLLRADPALSRETFEQAIERITRAGVVPNEECRADLSVPSSCSADIDLLWNELQRIRRAGAKEFDPIVEMADHIIFSTQFPREYLSLPPFNEVPANEVEILNLGDVPPEHPQWTGRARVEQCENLKALFLYGDGLDQQPLGINLSKLGSLRVLNLRDNGLRAIPEPVLSCQSLEALYLAGNPIESISGVEPMTGLKYLELYRSRVADEEAGSLKLKLPNCLIGTSSGARI